MSSFRRYLETRGVPEWKELNEYIYTPSVTLSQFLHRVLTLFNMNDMFTEEGNTLPVSIWFVHHLIIIHLTNTPQKDKIQYKPKDGHVHDAFSKVMKEAGVKGMTITFDDVLQNVFQTDKIHNYDFMDIIMPHLHVASQSEDQKKESVSKLYDDLYAVFERLEINEIKKKNARM